MAIEFPEPERDELPTNFEGRLHFLYAINDWENIFVEFGQEGILNELENRFKMRYELYIPSAKNKLLQATPQKDRQIQVEHEIEDFKSIRIKNTVFKNVYNNYKEYVVLNLQDTRAVYGDFNNEENKLLLNILNETNHFILNGQLISKIHEVVDTTEGTSPRQIWSNVAKAVFDFNLSYFKETINTEDTDLDQFMTQFT